MADRTRGALPPANLDGLIETLLDRLDDVDGRLRGLEANTGRALPGDWRFVPRDGEVVVRRISTGEECRICGPGFGECEVTFSATGFYDAGSDSHGVMATMTGLDALASVTVFTRPSTGCVRPAVPPSIEDMVAVGIYPTPGPTISGPLFEISPTGPSTCALGAIRLTGKLGGPVHTVVLWADGTGAGVGTTALSIDGGPWLSTTGLVSWSLPCFEGEG